MNKTNRMTALFLFSAMLTGTLAGCGGEPSSDTSAVTDSETKPVETTTAGYDYPDVDYNGYEFKILNIDGFYNCYVKTDVEEQTGEIVDDAVYNRNRKIEEKLGIKISEQAETFTGWNDRNKPATILQQDVTAGDENFDCVFVSMSGAPGIVTGGYVLDLNTVPGLNLDEDWWDTELNKSLEIDGKLFCATSSLQLSSLDLTWVLFFNKNILNNNKLEMPYDLVRDGKWTIDKMNEYVSACANLNGDDSFTFTAGSNATYGIAGHQTAPYMMLLAGDNKLLDTGKDGKLVFTGGTERLFGTIEKAAKLLRQDDGSVIFGDEDFSEGSYYYMFANERAAFLTTELKGNQAFRPYNVEFGILPAPKYDEAQANYISYASENIFRLCIPANASDPKRTGTILDALSYESKATVLPLYYNQTICQKGLRDDDSIEMLSIINGSRVTDIGFIFGITSSLVSEIKASFKNGGENAASIIAASKEKVEKGIADLYDAIK